MEDFVMSYKSVDGSVERHDRGGVAWYDAPIPWRLHRCRAQTFGYTSYFTYVERCACGAIRFGNERRWMGRNGRKRKQTAHPALGGSDGNL